VKGYFIMADGSRSCNADVPENMRRGCNTGLKPAAKRASYLQNAERPIAGATIIPSMGQLKKSTGKAQATSHDVLDEES
jgi:hypothetical protein